MSVSDREVVPTYRMTNGPMTVVGPARHLVRRSDPVAIGGEADVHKGDDPGAQELGPSLPAVVAPKSQRCPAQSFHP